MFHHYYSVSFFYHNVRSDSAFFISVVNCQILPTLVFRLRDMLHFLLLQYSIKCLLFRTAVECNLIRFTPSLGLLMSYSFESCFIFVRLDRLGNELFSVKPYNDNFLKLTGDSWMLSVRLDINCVILEDL